MAGSRNYLRVRGEYIATRLYKIVYEELPPRTRRIRGMAHSIRVGIGTTSAYAENTLTFCRILSRRWNYLRVRGEYPATIESLIREVELPPRTRRIPLGDGIKWVWDRTTSAYAENTLRIQTARVHDRNYLRVRGEYCQWWPTPRHARELPPRTRRILFRGDLSLNHRGTTSAYAENTSVIVFTFCGLRNYLRVRGEYLAHSNRPRA